MTGTVLAQQKQAETWKHHPMWVAAVVAVRTAHMVIKSYCSVDRKALEAGRLYVYCDASGDKVVEWAVLMSSAVVVKGSCGQGTDVHEIEAEPERCVHGEDKTFVGAIVFSEIYLCSTISDGCVFSYTKHQRIVCRRQKWQFIGEYFPDCAHGKDNFTIGRI